MSGCQRGNKAKDWVWGIKEGKKKTIKKEQEPSNRLRISSNQCCAPVIFKLKHFYDQRPQRRD